MTLTIKGLIEWALGLIDWQRVRKSLSLLVWRSVLGSVVTVLLLLLGILFTVLFVRDAAIYEEAFHDLLAREFASTPQRYKGLEAFIMSALPKGVDDSLKSSLVGQNLSVAINDLVAAINSGSILPAKSDEIRIADGGRGRILTDDASKGFLFFPVPILRGSLSGADLVNLSSGAHSTSNILKQILAKEINLLQEVAFTRQLVEPMQELASAEIFSAGPDALARENLRKKPVQVYIITRNGLNRIFKWSDEKPERFYARQFSWRTFFPSRPYFQNAINSEELPIARGLDELSKLKANDKLGDRFVISPPYIDLGGNGVVITLSRSLIISNAVEMVLCIDLNFFDILESKLKAKLRQFGAAPVSMPVDISKVGHVTAKSEIPSEAAKMFERLRALLVASKEGRAVALGNIVLLNEEESATGGPLEVSIPVQEVKLTDSEGGVETRFLLFRLDIAKYRWFTILYGGLAAACFGAMALLLTYLLAATTQRTKDFGIAFTRVAEVMQGAPLPYLRLDSHDRILDCNTSAAQMLGISDLTEAQRRELTFASFCANDVSSNTYTHVQSRRKLGERVEPYILTLASKGATNKFEVRVISADVPAVASGNFPITFGILLPTQSPQNRTAAG